MVWYLSAHFGLTPESVQTACMHTCRPRTNITSGWEEIPGEIQGVSVSQTTLHFVLPLTHPHIHIHQAPLCQRTNST